MFTDNIPQCNFNEAHYQKAWEGFMSSGIGVIFLIEESGEILGGIGGVKFPEPLTGDMTAVEMFWYVKPCHRQSLDGVKLLKCFERWAKAEKCKKVAMIHLMCSMPAKLEDFYIKNGYELIEKHYQKELTP